MNIVDLANKYKSRRVAGFNYLIDEISNYVMLEQTLIKKDNGEDASIKYRYDEDTYKYIDEFISEITFLSEPIIGTKKRVVIKDLPGELMYEDKHNFSLEDKIYLLDKIKDSFMHLKGDDTLYDIDFRDNTVTIRNVSNQYALDCKIPFSTLHNFNNRLRKKYLDKYPLNSEEVMLDDEINRGFRRFSRREFDNASNGSNSSSNQEHVVRCENGSIVLYKRLNENSFGRYKVIAKSALRNCYTSSYVSLLLASREDANYPLLNIASDMEVECDRELYIQLMEPLMKKIKNFYWSIYKTIDYFSQEEINRKVREFLYREENGKKVGLIQDISYVNNTLVKKLLRNARSHANLEEVDREIPNNPIMSYYDVTSNSHISLDNEKTIPSFVMIGYKNDFDKLFDDIQEHSISNEDFYNDLNTELSFGRNDLFEEYLSQLEGYIDQAYSNNIDYADYLKPPIGNASNFVDFIRKIMNGSFEYEENKGVGQR